MRASLTPLTELEELGHTWRELEISADISFFVSWSWIGPWLQLAKKNGVELFLYRQYNNDQTNALAVFSRSQVKRRKFFSYVVLALHEIPAGNLDMIIEYNGLLIRRGYESLVHQRLIDDLLTADVLWDELHLSGLPKAAWDEICSKPSPLKKIINEQRSTWATDISTANGDLEKLLSPLSRNRRWQIRRSIKAFETEGELQASLPSTLKSAFEYFDDMGRLHTARWNSVGMPGSFANSNWVEFHKDVLCESFSRNEVQLLKISNNAKPIGYIYSFLWRGTVYMLQSGFSQEEENVKRTGYVSHCLAMQFNSLAKHRIYDFMCGDSEYKSVLAKECLPLIWGVVQKNQLAFFFEKWLSLGVRNIRNLTKKT